MSHLTTTINITNHSVALLYTCHSYAPQNQDDLKTPNLRQYKTSWPQKKVTRPQTAPHVLYIVSYQCRDTSPDSKDLVMRVLQRTSSSEQKQNPLLVPSNILRAASQLLVDKQMCMLEIDVRIVRILNY